MPPAIPVVAAVAAAAASASIAAIPLGVLAGGAFVGLGLSSATIGAIAGGLIAASINLVGTRALAKKPKAQAFTQEAAGRTLSLRSSVESHKIIYGTARVSGPLVYIDTTDSGTNNNGETVTGPNKFIHLVIPLAGHEIDSVTAYFLNDQEVVVDGNGWVTSTPYFKDTKSYARIKLYKGADDQEASPDLIAETHGFDADHRLRGIAYLHVRFEYNADVFPQGIPNVSAVVRGKKVYDPRSGTTAWSANAALCVRDYLSSDYGFDCSSSEINDTYGIAAANVCDETVTKADGSTQPRYSCNGVVDTAVAPLDNLQALVTSLAGAVAYVQGAFRIHAAAYETPAGDIGIDLLAGDVQIDWRAGRKESFNAVKGTYVDPAKGWQPTDFPAVTNATYQTEDNGEQVFKDIELPFTTDPEAAQRLAKITLEKGRQGIRVTIPVNHAALKYTAWDVVTLTNAQLGWTAKPFRVLRWNISPPGPITLSLQEESSASYAWNSGEASTIDAAPDTTLPNPFVIAPPGNPVVTEALYQTRDSAGVKVKATVSYSASPNPFVTRYVTEYKLSTATDFTVLGTTDSTSVEIPDIAPGIYTVRTKAISNLGVSSDYAITTVEIYGLSARPADTTGLTLQLVSSLAVLRWDQHPDLDVTSGGRILIRHTEELITPTWESSYSIGEEAGDKTLSLLPLKAGTYLVKAEDSSGLTSVNEATVSTKNASVLTFSNLSTIQEDSLFSGTHSGTYADGGALSLAGTGLFDAISNFDAVNGLDAYGGVGATGTYTFASGTNNGSIKKVRVETSLAIQTVNVNDRIDSRSGDVDDWLDFDGSSSGGSVDCRVECRQTDTDPTGSPTWGGWQRLDAADIEAWGIQYRAILTSSDPAFNPAVTKLRITVKEVT